MGDIKVRVLDDVEQKSKQQVEEELLKKHEDQFEDSTESAPVSENTETKTEEVVENQKPSYSDDDVLSHINERYGKTINSLDELFEERGKSEELPEDVAAYFKYKKETGRSIEDFVKLNRDFSKVDPDELLANYYKTKDEYLDDDDVISMLDELNYDEDLDDEKDIKKLKLAKKRQVAEAKKFFEERKSQYNVPLESSVGNGIDEKTQKELEAYREQQKTKQGYEDIVAKNRKDYLQKLDETFNSDFKGFEFKIDDNTFSYNPGSVDELKSKNNDVTGWVKSYLDNNGQIKDYKGFHKALAVVNYPDKFAKFFYEKGQADAVTSDAKKAKNIDLKMNKAPETSSKGGLQVKSTSNPSDGNRLTIRKRK